MIRCVCALVIMTDVSCKSIYVVSAIVFRASISSARFSELNTTVALPSPDEAKAASLPCARSTCSAISVQRRSGATGKICIPTKIKFKCEFLRRWKRSDDKRDSLFLPSKQWIRLSSRRFGARKSRLSVSISVAFASAAFAIIAAASKKITREIVDSPLLLWYPVFLALQLFSPQIYISG
ncbi:hypothetical protein B0H12DRAFT_1125200 [Mycena haematopus]|nr:hypothetical protein B0H12DRAFT_1125200 [Mycena haematopus]